MPLPMRLPSAGSTAESGSVCVTGLASPRRPRAGFSFLAVVSTRVFHSPHSGQRPSHFGSSRPQEEHLYTRGFCFFNTFKIREKDKTGNRMHGLLPYNIMIFEIRGYQVMLDADLAGIYQVETKVLNQAVKRNRDRFPPEFMFQLTKDEYENLRSQIVTSKYGQGGR
jgi:hypothetical protein